MVHLRPLLHLKELFFMGNPLQDWPSHRLYIIAMLPQLQTYDGVEVCVLWACSVSVSACQPIVLALQSVQQRAHCSPSVTPPSVSQVTRTERIRASQSLASMRSELRELAARKREEKGLPASRVEVVDDDDVEIEQDVEGDDGLSPWTPEERTRMYRELAEQKEEQEKSKSHMDPKKRFVVFAPTSVFGSVADRVTLQAPPCVLLQRL
jgi:hypothetical protein